MHFVDEGVDTGQLVMRETLDSSCLGDSEEVEKNVHEWQANMFVKSIKLLESGNYEEIDTFFERSSMTRGFTKRQRKKIYSLYNEEDLIKLN